MNSLIAWRVETAVEDRMTLQLDFKDPLYVSQGPILCRIKVLFGDGSDFKSAGYSNSLKKKQ